MPRVLELILKPVPSVFNERQKLLDTGGTKTLGIQDKIQYKPTTQYRFKTLNIRFG